MKYGNVINYVHKVFNGPDYRDVGDSLTGWIRYITQLAGDSPTEWIQYITKLVGDKSFVEGFCIEMNVRNAFLVTLVLAMASLYLLGLLERVFPASSLLIFLILPILSVIIMSSRCPKCGEYLQGVFQIYGALFNGQCKNCHKS